MNGNRDVRVVSANGGDWYVVQYLMAGPGRSHWRNLSEWESPDAAIEAATEFAATSGHSTASQVIWRSWV